MEPGPQPTLGPPARLPEGVYRALVAQPDAGFLERETLDPCEGDQLLLQLRDDPIVASLRQDARLALTQDRAARPSGLRPRSPLCQLLQFLDGQLSLLACTQALHEIAQPVPGTSAEA